MCRFGKIGRFFRSRGYGIHSPFAYRLITEVLRSPYHFYAFSDIERLLDVNGMLPRKDVAFHRLSFRLVHYLKPRHILEIGSGKGVNTLYITAPDLRIVSTCIENDTASIKTAQRLLHQFGTTASFREDGSFDTPTTFDAIFVNTHTSPIPDISMLLSISHERTFWVFHPLKQHSVKQLYRKIVNDEHVRLSFDMNRVAVLFIDPSYYKENYCI